MARSIAGLLAARNSVGETSVGLVNPREHDPGPDHRFRNRFNTKPAIQEIADPAAVLRERQISIKGC
jgi:hypothetical protein